MLRIGHVLAIFFISFSLITLTSTVTYAQSYPTSLVLDPIPSSVYTDQIVTFTGKLTSNGNPLSNKLVIIMEDDPFWIDQRLVGGYTDQNGRFSFDWDVEGGYVETDFDIYASFDGDSTYSYARSYNQILSVFRYGGSISLDPFPSSAPIGDVVIFSGKLELNKGSTEGAIVYIKDEDPFTGDDLLATAYVGKDGRFSVNWFVNYVDEDDVADIYAVFEGNADLNRQTTCDIGGTMPIGGLCSNTIPLRISGTITPTVPTPPSDDILAGEEYIQLFYSIDFTRTPRVAIVPSPDSYNEVQRHIIPIQEGIIMWKSGMEQKYGGDWNVDFEIISKDALFFKQKPDVVVNLVTHDDEVECFMEVAGWALIRKNPPETIQTYVCSTTLGIKRSNQDVEATAAHEFIHAVGLGHTFNKKWDMMCSSEYVNGEWIPTCPGGTSGKSKTPSDLDLAGTAKLYGNDGFKIPNNRITYGMKFALDDNQNGGVPIQPTPKPTPPPPTLPTPPKTPTIPGSLLGDYKVFESKRFGFTIEYPSDWLVDDEVISYDEGESIVAFSLDNSWTTWIYVNYELISPNMIGLTGNSYLNQIEKDLVEWCSTANYEEDGLTCDYYSPISTKKISVNGIDAYQIDYTFQKHLPEGFLIDTFTRQVEIPVGNYNWQIITESKKSRFNDYENEFVHAINSFQTSKIVKPTIPEPSVPTLIPKIQPKSTVKDSDNDGIIDNWDQCPFSPETINGYYDYDGCPDSKPRVPDFVNPAKGAQYYIDRYNNEPEYKKWFHESYPEYSITKAIELAIPDAFSKTKKATTPPDTKQDSTVCGPGTVLKNGECVLDKCGPGTVLKDGICKLDKCGPGTVLKNGKCVLEEKKVEKSCFRFLWWCW